MFDIVIILCRYLFVILIVNFVIQGFKYILAINGNSRFDPATAISKQRTSIAILHIAAFLILAYKRDEYAFDITALVVGALAFAFLIAVQFTLPKVYNKSCPLVWNCMFLLLDIGLIMIFRLDSNLAQRQLFFAFTGFLLMLLVPLVFKIIPRFEKLELFYLICGGALLLLPFVFGVERNGATNWVQIGPISFQPSEFVKLLYLLYLASVFRKELNIKQLILPTAMAALFTVVLVAQKDLGGALIFFMSYSIIMYISTGKEWLFLSAVAAAGAASFVAYKLFAHVRVRVLAWHNPWTVIDREGYQVTQSFFAISTWGVLGSGLTRGKPGYIPFAENDFIFPAICEEFGIIFGICVVMVFAMMFYMGAVTAVKNNRRFHSMLACGVTNILAFQTFLIMGGNINLIPLTGVTLPFMSYGGTSLMICMLMTGLLQWVNQRLDYSRKALESGDAEIYGIGGELFD